MPQTKPRNYSSANCMQCTVIGTYSVWIQLEMQKYRAFYVWSWLAAKIVLPCRTLPHLIQSDALAGTSSAISLSWPLLFFSNYSFLNCACRVADNFEFLRLYLLT